MSGKILALPTGWAFFGEAVWPLEGYTCGTGHFHDGFLVESLTIETPHLVYLRIGRFAAWVKNHQDLAWFPHNMTVGTAPLPSPIEDGKAGGESWRDYLLDERRPLLLGHGCAIATLDGEIHLAARPRAGRYTASEQYREEKNGPKSLHGELGDYA